MHAFKGEGEVIAYFGDAKLVRRLDCKFELRGASDEERAAARESSPARDGASTREVSCDVRHGR